VIALLRLAIAQQRRAIKTFRLFLSELALHVRRYLY